MYNILYVVAATGPCLVHEYHLKPKITALLLCICAVERLNTNILASISKHKSLPVSEPTMEQRRVLDPSIV